MGFPVGLRGRGLCLVLHYARGSNDALLLDYSRTIKLPARFIFMSFKVFLISCVCT